MNMLTLLLLLGTLMPAISSSSLHNKISSRNFNSSSTHYGNFSSKDVRFPNASHYGNFSSKDTKSLNVSHYSLDSSSTSGGLPPIAIRSLSGTSELLLTMVSTLANLLGLSANARTCPQPNLFVAGGVTLCEGSTCPVELGKMLARFASSVKDLEYSWLYVSGTSPDLEGGELESRDVETRNDENYFDDAWRDIEQYSLQLSLYPILDTLPPTVRAAKLETISKFWFLQGLAHYKQFDAPLASNQITLSDYRCSGQLATTSSPCPTWSASFTSPTRAVSTYVCLAIFLIADTYD